jgi:hypothetical protein
VADGKLIFLRPASGSGKLVLGDATSGSVVPDVEISIDVGFAGDSAADVRLACGVLLAVDAEFAAEGAADLQLLWDANVSRGGLRHELRSHWQPAIGQASALGTAWQQAQPQRLGVQSSWQNSSTRRSALQSYWQDTRRLRAANAARWQQGQLRRAAVDLLWQEAERLRAAVALRWQQATPHRAASRSHWQEMLRVRAAMRGHWQHGVPLQVHFVTRYGDGLPVRLPLRPHWQEAWRPRSGVSLLPTPPGPAPCYDPARLGLLVFHTPYTGDGRLVFICHRTDPGPQPGTVVVPIRKVYVTVNSITLRRVVGNVPLQAEAFSMSIDAESWTWSWSSTLPASAREYLAPVDGLPVVVEATVNGVPYRLCAESMARSRSHGSARITVQGRGLGAVLDAPYAPSLNFGNATTKTAQQLAADALTLNGVGIGWDVAWGLTDWQVPAGLWAHQGSYISAINAIATAVGGYVQPHATAQTLRILPRYPAMPWAWGALTPDYELPADVVEVEGVEWASKPAYNWVHVAGVAGGVQVEAKRAGTAGDVDAPSITDPLITHVDAARQRAAAVLADTGPQATVSLRLPVLATTGLIQPGKFVRYLDGAVTRVGIVRGTALDWQRPTLRQTLTVETHGTD